MNGQVNEYILCVQTFMRVETFRNLSEWARYKIKTSVKNARWKPAEKWQAFPISPLVIEMFTLFAVLLFTSILLVYSNIVSSFLPSFTYVINFIVNFAVCFINCILKYSYKNILLIFDTVNNNVDLLQLEKYKARRSKDTSTNTQCMEQSDDELLHNEKPTSVKESGVRIRNNSFA